MAGTDIETLPQIQPEKRHPVRDLVQAGIYVLASAGGLFAGAMAIRQDFMNEIKNHPFFAKARQDRNVTRNDIIDQGRAGKLTFAQQIEKRVDAERKYTTSVNGELKKMGIETRKGPISLIKGTWQRFHWEGGEDRHRTILRAGLSAVVTVGAVLLVASNYRLRTKVHEQEEKQNSPDHAAAVLAEREASAGAQRSA